MRRAPRAQNDLQFLRIRSKEHEIMVYAGALRRRALRAVRSRNPGSARAHAAFADPAFTLIVIQDPSVGTSSHPDGGRESDSAARRLTSH